MEQVKHVVYIDGVSGEIKRIDLSSAIIPEQGTDPETGDIILHIYEDLPDPAGFADTNYYDFTVPALSLRPEKPNSFGYWTGASWAWDEDAFINFIRSERNIKLTKTDWTQIPDSQLTGTQKAEAQQYRQQLRDLPAILVQNPQNYPTEESIPWPTPPAFLSSEI